jgi:hypothetical protein
VLQRAEELRGVPQGAGGGRAPGGPGGGAGGGVGGGEGAALHELHHLRIVRMMVSCYWFVAEYRIKSIALTYELQCCYTLTQ